MTTLFIMNHHFINSHLFHYSKQLFHQQSRSLKKVNPESQYDLKNSVQAPLYPQIQSQEVFNHQFQVNFANSSVQSYSVLNNIQSLQLSHAFSNSSGIFELNNPSQQPQHALLSQQNQNGALQMV